MTVMNNLTQGEFSSLHVVSQRVFKLIAQELDMNSVYIVKKNGSQMHVFSVYNRYDVIVPEGFNVPYQEAYCSHVLSSETGDFQADDLRGHDSTKEMHITEELGAKGFIGVPLCNRTGEVFGTLCALDKQEKRFSNKDISYLKAMAELLSHIIELDETKVNLSYLNLPVIPITDGVAILPVQGVIDEKRAETLMEEMLKETAERQLDYVILDLSGLVTINEQFPDVLIRLIQAVNLMGAGTVLTGISPQTAMHQRDNDMLKDTKAAPNLEAALKMAGLYISKEANEA
ncbi:GAF domain-containing protein [Bacillus luteus]|uniref:GAF domain-containing protein n=2 Tax=Alkalicoccus luteus TaxID=1237094 RepID=A0A969PTE1_9BACI|nr:GAF domain-containing protein [Alkalicoccus luteus]